LPDAPHPHPFGWQPQKQFSQLHAVVAQWQVMVLFGVAFFELVIFILPFLICA